MPPSGESPPLRPTPRWLIGVGEPETLASLSIQAAHNLLCDSCLHLQPFLPSSCCDSSRQRFEQWRRALGQAAADPAAARPDAALTKPRLAFLTPVMARGLGKLRRLPFPLEWPYRESLALLRSSVDQPAVQALVAILRLELPRILQMLVPGGVAAIR